MGYGLLLGQDVPKTSGKQLEDEVTRVVRH